MHKADTGITNDQASIQLQRSSNSRQKQTVECDWMILASGLNLILCKVDVSITIFSTNLSFLYIQEKIFLSLID